MILDQMQKEVYIQAFDENYILDYLKEMINSEWELVYDPQPNEFDYKLIIAGDEFDRLDISFADQIKKGEI